MADEKAPEAKPEEKPVEKSADTNPAPKENLDAPKQEEQKPQAVQSEGRGVGLHNR